MLAEQNVDIPVPHGRAGRAGQAGLQGFSQGQGSTAFSGADLVDTPVPQGRGGFGGPQGFLPSSSGASSSHSPGAVDEAFTGFFRTFPQIKKIGVGSALGVGTGCGLSSMDSGGLCRLHARGGEAGDRVGVGVGAGGGRRDSLLRWVSAYAGLHTVPGAPHGSARTGGCAYGDRCTFAHSWAELHLKASAHAHELASYLPE